MRAHSLPLLVASVVTAVPGSARAQEHDSAHANNNPAAVTTPNRTLPKRPEHPPFDDQLVLDTGRAAVTSTAPRAVHFQIHGEYQLRGTFQTDLPLTPPPTDPSAKSLGQTDRLVHWLRITPRLDIGNHVSVIGQIDFPEGFIAGQVTHDVTTAADPMAEHQPWGVQPRWLYAEARSKYADVRVGQQPLHWGMGLVSNDGDHPTVFGDYRRGSIMEQLELVLRPVQGRVPVQIDAAANMVFWDPQADLAAGDRAWQGIVGIAVGKPEAQAGFRGIVRQQHGVQNPVNSASGFASMLDTRTADFYAQFSSPVPGASGFVFGQLEAAVVAGQSQYVLAPSPAATLPQTQVRSWGTAFSLGAVHEAASQVRRWGDFVVQVEWGYASGDSNPNDHIQSQFAFDPNHHVGLVLFNQVMAWTTARSAYNLNDGPMRNQANAGAQGLVTNGAVAGAAYLYPTIVVRPKHWLDLRGGMVLAQATADVVDPYQFALTGTAKNFRGGDPARRDLGLEFDLGAEARAAVGHGVTLQFGLQAGLFIAGHAFDDAQGNSMPCQYLVTGRAGVQY